jgi:D-3-phosphoglycerate dehydrogenase
LSWRIAITEGLAPEGVAVLRARAEVAEAPSDLGAFDAMIVRSKTQVTDAVIASGLPRLKVVGRAGVGTDNIDLEACRAAGVTVVNAPEAATAAVAEHTLALMLALARDIPFADASLRAGEWPKKDLLGIELRGKTLGIVGMGRIGSAVARMGAALRMKPIGHDPLLTDETIMQAGAEPGSLDEVLAQADFLTLHVPLTNATRNLVNAEALRKMKPTARLICTARGGVIDEEAVLQALNTGRLAGAALDVFLVEPPAIRRLLQHRRVVATPHIGAQTAEAQSRASLDIAHEVLAALAGTPLRWRVV